MLERELGLVLDERLVQQLAKVLVVLKGEEMALELEPDSALEMAHVSVKVLVS